MAKKYIDSKEAQKLINKHLDDMVEDASISDFEIEIYGMGCRNCANILNSIPAADVAPVVHAHWLYDGIDEWHCTACGDAVWSDDKYRYCPNCGAKMDKEARE